MNISTTVKYAHSLKQTPSKKQIADYKKHISNINIMKNKAFYFLSHSIMN